MSSIPFEKFFDKCMREEYWNGFIHGSAWTFVGGLIGYGIGYYIGLYF